ncbi:Essential protein Yae1, N terminal [Toensbergia leucococca]|nr:Essential protein Yae1, N terminal [Toensbergia leucococca]
MPPDTPSFSRTTSPVDDTDSAKRRTTSTPAFLEPLSDIFYDSPPPSPSHSSTTSLQLHEPSDVPRLRTTHTTAGYRDGIAASKAQSIQSGFDEGYSLGAILGLRVGYVLGALEGLCAAQHALDDKKRLLELLTDAKEGLKLEKVFGRELWSEDGVWAYQVKSKEEEVTFREVVDAHPILRTWIQKVREEFGTYRIDEGRFSGSEWESGRLDDAKKS